MVVHLASSELGQAAAPSWGGGSLFMAHPFVWSL